MQRLNIENNLFRFFLAIASGGDNKRRTSLTGSSIICKTDKNTFLKNSITITDALIITGLTVEKYKHIPIAHPTIENIRISPWFLLSMMKNTMKDANIQ